MANVTPQTFNPDNVMMHEHKEGELLNDFNEPILLDVLQNSKIMQLGQYQDMGGKSEKKFTYWADKPGAYWVGEGQKFKLLNLAYLKHYAFSQIRCDHCSVT